MADLLSFFSVLKISYMSPDQRHISTAYVEDIILIFFDPSLHLPKSSEKYHTL